MVLKNNLIGAECYKAFTSQISNKECFQLNLSPFPGISKEVV